MSALTMGFAKLQIVPVMTGFNSSVKKELGSAFPQLGKAAGSDFGKGVADGFSSEKKSLESEVKSLESNLAKAQENLKKAKGASATATDKETDALKKLEIAQLKLNETRDSGKAKASQLATAEENVRQKQNALKKVQQESLRATTNLENATEDLSTAQSKLDGANKKISDSTKKLDTDFGKTGGAFKRMADSMRNGFKKVPKDAEKAGKDAGKKASGGFTKNFAVGGAVAGVFGSLTSSLTSSIGGLVSEAFTASDDTNKFMSSMDFAGISESATKAAAASAQKYADETVYDLSTIQSTMAQLASNGIKNYDELAKASGNLNAVSGGNAETFKSVSMVMSQTAGAGKLTTENFNQIADAIPGASGQIQKALLEAGAYTGNFRDAMADGEISAQEFNDAVLKLGNQPIAVEAAKSTETFEGALGNLQATIVGGLTTALNNLKPTLTGIVNGASDGIAKFIEVVKGMVQWAQDNSAWLLPVVSAIAGMASAVLIVIGAIKAWTIAQAALNLVMSLNPFGIIVLAIGALIGTFLYLWNNVEGFRNFWITVWTAISGFFVGLWEGYLRPAFTAIGTVFGQVIGAIAGFWNNTLKPVFVAIGAVFKTIWETVLKVAFTALKIYISAVFIAIAGFWNLILKPVFRALGTFFKWVWETLLRPAFNALKIAFRAVVDSISWVWKNLLKPVFDTLGRFFKWVWESLLKPAFDALKRGFKAVVDGIGGFWNNILKPIFEALGNFITDTVAPAFQKGIDTIKDIWESIKKFASKPVKFMIDTVYNKGIVPMVNTMIDKIGLNKDWKLPELEFKGFATGGYTGNGGKYQEMGVVHGGEFVLQKSATTRLREQIGLSGLNHMNKTGQMPGYSSGGLVKPVRGGTITSRFGASRGRYPHSGLDWAVPTGTPIYAAMDGTVSKAGTNAITGRTGIGAFLSHDGGRNTYYGHLSKLLVGVGDIVKAGQKIALSGSTGNSTGPHLHFETWSGGKPLNPENYLTGAALPAGGVTEGAGLVQQLLEFKDVLVTDFKNEFPEANRFVDYMKGIGQNVVQGIWEKVSSIVDFGQDVWGNTKDFFNGKDSDVQAAVRGVAKEYGWDTGRHWDSLSKIINKESSWNPNAANPNSSARGLFQKMTSIHGALEGTPDGQARWGLNYIKERYGDPEKAWKFHKSHGYYSKGGQVPTYDNGGYLQPGGHQVISNLSGKPEPVFTHGQWKILSQIVDERVNGQATTTYNINVPEPAFSASDLADEIQHRNRAIRRGR